MKRVDHESRVDDKFGAGKHGRTDGDPVDPSSGTVVAADDLDAMQEEICTVIETLGGTVDPGNNDNLRAALSGHFLSQITGGQLNAPIYPIRSDTPPGLTEGQAILNEITIPSTFRHLYTVPLTGGVFGIYTGVTGGLYLARNCAWLPSTSEWTAIGSGPTVLNLATTGISISDTLSGGTFASTLPYKLAEPVSIGVEIIGGAITLLSGSKGVQSSGITFNADDIVITFEKPFADGNYRPIANANNSDVTVNAIRIDATQCYVAAYAIGSGARISPAFDTVFFTLNVDGSLA